MTTIRGSACMERDKSIDAVAGMMIIVMVVGHCVAEGYLKTFINVLNFFMPWFYYKSGMFYRVQSNLECIIGGGKKLLAPYIKYTFLGWIVASILMALRGDYNWMHYVLTPFKEILSVGAIQGNLVLWFLPTLFASKVIFNYCLLKGIPSLVIALMTLTTGNVIYYTGNPVPPYITTTFTGLFFYSMGYMLRDYQNKKPLCYASLLGVLCFWIMGLTIVNMKNNILLTGYYPLWYLFSVMGCVAVNYVFRKSPYSFPILRWVGVNSLIIYCTHWIFLNIWYFVIGDGIGYITANCYTLFVLTMMIEFILICGIKVFVSARQQ